MLLSVFFPVFSFIVSFNSFSFHILGLHSPVCAQLSILLLMPAFDSLTCFTHTHTHTPTGKFTYILCSNNKVNKNAPIIKQFHGPHQNNSSIINSRYKYKHRVRHRYVCTSYSRISMTATHKQKMRTRLLLNF